MEQGAPPSASEVPPRRQLPSAPVTAAGQARGLREGASSHEQGAHGHSARLSKALGPSASQPADLVSTVGWTQASHKDRVPDGSLEMPQTPSEIGILAPAAACLLQGENPTGRKET